MKKLLRKTLNTVIMNNNLVTNIGLIDGKMGIAILLYHGSRITGCKSYQDTADSLLDEILEKIGPSVNLSFSKGLAGIAFGLNHLIKHRFIDADSDDLLTDIDEKLFLSLNTDNNNDFINNNFPLFSYGLYLNMRIKDHQKINLGIDFLAKRGIQICGGFLKNNLVFNSTNIIYANSILYYLISLKKSEGYQELINPLLDLFLRKAIQSVDSNINLYRNLGISLDLLLSIPGGSSLLEELQSKCKYSYNGMSTEKSQDFDLDNIRQELLYFSYSKQSFEVGKLNTWVDERLDAVLDYNAIDFCKEVITVGLWIVSEAYKTRTRTNRYDITHIYENT